MNLQTKVVIITGAASGIGRELAFQCASQGAQLALNDLDAEALEQLSQQLRKKNVRLLSSAYDASSRAAAADFLAEIMTTFGRVDILINNAGIALMSQDAQTVSPEDMERILQVNLWSVIHHTQLFLPELERSAGMLVNLSSAFGLVGYAYQAPYVMSKFAVRGLTETLRQEYANSPVTISCVHPGGVKTRLIRHVTTTRADHRDRLAALFEQAALTSSEKAAATIIKGIRKRKSRILVGPDARWFDLLARLFPNFYHRFMPKAFDPKRFKKHKSPPQATALQTEDKQVNNLMH